MEPSPVVEAWSFLGCCCSSRRGLKVLAEVTGAARASFVLGMCLGRKGREPASEQAVSVPGAASPSPPPPFTEGEEASCWQEQPMGVELTCVEKSLCNSLPTCGALKCALDMART